MDLSKYKINHVTNYRYWTLEEIYNSDYSYLLYLLQTHKTCDTIKQIIYDFLKTKGRCF